MSDDRSKQFSDFETKSEVDLDERGSKNYFAGKYADLVMFGYAGHEGRPKVWLPGQPLLDCFKNPHDYIFYYHNALFDYRAWNTIGVPRYGFAPLRFSYIIDTMALGARYTLYLDLQRLCDTLETPVRKDRYGKALIKRICVPPFQFTSDEFSDFIEYCKDDVASMRDAVCKLPAPYLAPYEQRVWQLTQEINEKGLPVDLKSVHQILDVTTVYKEEHAKLLPHLTDNLVHTIGQTQKIRDFCAIQGLKLPNLQAATVEKALARDDIPEVVRDVLVMRRDLGRSSTTKFAAIANLTHNGFIHDNLVYYGAQKTGRFAGRGLQPHNLPRAKVKDPDAEIAKFWDLTILEEKPIQSAKALIRPMIKAPPGFKLIVSDYSGIENRLLAWIVGDDMILAVFTNGLCEYRYMAMDLYHIEYDEVNDDQRFRGKVVVLGCGYGLGAKGFIDNAAGWGWKVTFLEAETLVNGYRRKYRKVVRFWYDAKDAAIAAIRVPGSTFTVNNCSFRLVRDHTSRRWLQISLPSGRALYYMEPEIRDDRFGPGVTHMGINPYSKKWQRLKLIPGRIVENIIQALARDILCHGKLKLAEAGYDLRCSVHDETISLAKESDISDGTLEHYNKVMCDLPAWAEGLPLEAAGYIADRYRKD